MASTIFITFGDRTVMIARPQAYQDLLRDTRSQYPMIASVQNLVVLFQPLLVNGNLHNQWVQVDPTAYGAVHDGAELFVNVVHPLNKEYILPLPNQSNSNGRFRKQIRRTDGLGNPLPADGEGLNDEVSTSRPRCFSRRYKTSTLSLELERTGGDAFTSGWGGASERFRRSMKLVPNIRDCKEAIGQTVGQSNFYPDEEEEKTADHKPGFHQNQNPPPAPTDAGWYAGTETHVPGVDPNTTSAQHLAGGAEDEGQGKKTTHYHPNRANHKWHAVSTPRDFLGASLESHGYPMPTGSDRDEMHDADQEYSRIAADARTDVVADRAPSTNGGTNHEPLTNGNTTNGNYNIHHQVSQYTRHQDENIRVGAWSPTDPQYDSYERLQYPRMRGYLTPVAGLRPLHDPAQVTYGSPRAKIRGTTSGWTTIGHKRDIWTNNHFQEDDGHEEAQGFAHEADRSGDNHSWYAPPPPNSFNWTTGHREDKGASKHRITRPTVERTNKFQQKQRVQETMSWGSDFWGGPPPKRNNRNIFAPEDSPASRHW
ncbi:hypothetical protein N8I77_001557 [Diaporthe amygdali]|uniref:Uncharacterized protein n=1 Tax=Phomopsis amygdali TaxID=1214568 RepID=A0AAD9SPA6_PHOAM|nr:hypothetical protein N8I77_001557 [Diaporthe amygdali]